ncbi:MULTISPECIES: SDR family oxidoreductase [Paenibacillus]|uniref:SDR family oxidoreductase n=1 Tax=Paenibacillus TaxID=44249 RepID=UPI00119EAA67|nr:SDR family oxidoreductase [Paenibacillus sp. Y412MC10]
MKTILITGASSGIGKAAAKHFADKGWNVVATMRSPEKDTELSQLENVLVTKLDVEQQETIQEAIKMGMERFGTIDVLLNNAGYGAMGIFEAASNEQIQKQFEVNVFGLMRVIKAILPHFRTKKDGVIINISSMGGKIGFPTLSLYHSTKFAVEGFTEALTFELASQNIRLKLIEPGVVKTDFFGRSIEILSDESLTDYQEFFEAVQPALHETINSDSISSPELIAQTIYQAATDGTHQFRYVVGEDAKTLLKLRRELGEEAFLEQMTQTFA